jgi:hypothetical protein
MAKRKRHRRVLRLSPDDRQRLREELPPGVTLDAMGDLCRFLDPSFGEGRCRGDEHSLAGTVNWIADTEFWAQESEILAWLGALGGVCNCTIRSRAFPRVLQLSRDLWE